MGSSGKPLATSRYATESRPGHPMAWADGRVRVHRAVLYDEIGPGEHPCHRCGQMVAWQGRPPLVVDHLDGNTWNNDPENLAPACDPCNRSRHLLDATTCRNGHERTEENTYWRRYPDGRETRMCRDCSRKSKRVAKIDQSGANVGGPVTPKRVQMDASCLTVGKVRAWLLANDHLPDEVSIALSRWSR